MGVEPASVRPCVHPSTLSDMNITATSKPTAIKFYLKHHWGRGKAALSFRSDSIRTVVYMATDSSHRALTGKRYCHSFSADFHPIFFILAGNDDMHESSKDFKIQPGLTTGCGVSCP